MCGDFLHYQPCFRNTVTSGTVKYSKYIKTSRARPIHTVSQNKKHFLIVLLRYSEHNTNNMNVWRLSPLSALLQKYCYIMHYVKSSKYCTNIISKTNKSGERRYSECYMNNINVWRLSPLSALLQKYCYIMHYVKSSKYCTNIISKTNKSGERRYSECYMNNINVWRLSPLSALLQKYCYIMHYVKSSKYCTNIISKTNKSGEGRYSECIINLWRPSPLSALLQKYYYITH